MKHVYINELSLKTVDACGMFIVGGFSPEKEHIPAIPKLRPPQKESLYDVCYKAEAGDYESRIFVENLIIEELATAKELIVGNTHYHYDITEFTCQRSMDILVHEVLAQVNED